MVHRVTNKNLPPNVTSVDFGKPAVKGPSREKNVPTKAEFEGLIKPKKEGDPKISAANVIGSLKNEEADARAHLPKELQKALADVEREMASKLNPAERDELITEVINKYFA